MISPYYETKLGKLYCSDFNILNGDRIFKSNSVDLIFTDPPYEKKYFYLYENLAMLGYYILRRGGSLLTIAPHYSLNSVCKVMDKYLKYRWVLCMNQFSGSHSRMSMGIEIMWKPIVWYVKEVFSPYRGMIRDGIEINGKAGQKKKLHKWEQDIDWCEYYISHLTNENDLVVDPMVGSGTVAVVCEKLNRRWVGIDISEEYCKIVSERLDNFNREII